MTVTPVSQPSQQQPSRRDRRQLQTALAAVFAAGLPASAAAGWLIQTLTAAGYPAAVAVLAIKITGAAVPADAVTVAGQLPAVSGFAAVDVARQELVYQVAYLIAAADRLSRAFYADERSGTVDTGTVWGPNLQDALRGEVRFRRLHTAAAAHRRAAAVRVDRAAAEHGPKLGWYLGQVRTVHTPVCRAAAGHDFDARRRPLPGWPGTSHAMCACHPGPPHGSRLSVDEVTRPLIARGLD